MRLSNKQTMVNPVLFAETFQCVGQFLGKTFKSDRVNISHRFFSLHNATSRLFIEQDLWGSWYLLKKLDQTSVKSRRHSSVDLSTAHHPAVLGLNLKHSIYAFSIYRQSFTICHCIEKKQKVTCSWCYKTFFWGNLDFPKINKWKKVCSDVLTCTKVCKQCYF